MKVGQNLKSMGEILRAWCKADGIRSNFYGIEPSTNETASNINWTNFKIYSLI